MKKFCLVLCIITLFTCVFTVTSFAASEKHDWGRQSIYTEAEYATWDNDGEEETTRKMEYDNVGYTYINASCAYSGASFTTTIQKRGFLWIWSDKMVSNGVINSTVEYGQGGDYGSGTYRFLLTPSNTTYPSGNGMGLSPINFQNFYSNSSD